jgi:hypothetical protein
MDPMSFEALTPTSFAAPVEKWGRECLLRERARALLEKP